MKITIKSKLPYRPEYMVILLIGFTVHILSNAYFGWNETAQSGAERVWDYIWMGLVSFGGFGVCVRSLIEEVHNDQLRAGTLPKGTVVPWLGSDEAIPRGWLKADGTNDTPNLCDKNQTHIIKMVDC